jgi:hypothetical protein
MDQQSVDVVIDNHHYTTDQLLMYDYQRQLHVLHQMTRLGAPVHHDGAALTHDDIDGLTHPQARALSIRARQDHDIAGITALYAAQLRTSDRMWKDINTASGRAPLVSALVDVTIRGRHAGHLAGGARDIADMGRNFVEFNADHFAFAAEGERTRVIETFGMYGGPTDSYITVDPSVSVPVEPEAGYTVLTAGFTTLSSDGADINVRALHQIKRLADGLTIKLGAFFPAATPAQILHGHQIHMALEVLFMVARDGTFT